MFGRAGEIIPVLDRMMDEYFEDEYLPGYGLDSKGTPKTLVSLGIVGTALAVGSGPIGWGLAGAALAYEAATTRKTLRDRRAWKRRSDTFDRLRDGGKAYREFDKGDYKREFGDVAIEEVIYYGSRSEVKLFVDAIKKNNPEKYIELTLEEIEESKFFIIRTYY